MKDVLYNMLYILITGCGIVMVKYVVGLINEQIDQAQTSVEQDWLNYYIDIAQSIISSAVESTTQTYVDALKKAGQFNEEAQKTAKEKALAIAKKMLTEEVRNAIVEVYGDLDTYLDSMLETMVHQNKK